MFDQATLDAIDQVAKQNNIESAALQACAFKESAGRAFWTVGGKQVPAIRFEGHYFYRALKNTPKKLQAARAAGLADPRAGAVKNPNSWSGRYDMLQRAKKIDEAAALCAISMGLGQVMGANFAELGYPTVQAMWKDCCDGVAGQVRVMVAFIRRHGLDKNLNAHDWNGFARTYNGPSYKRNHYARDLAKYYKMLVGGSLGDSQTEGVRWVQQSLIKLGYKPGKADGKLGPMTREAIKKFQTNNGLVVDGDPGTMTVQTIHEALDKQVKVKKANVAPKVAAAAAGGSVAVGDITHAVTTATSAAKTAHDSGVSVDSVTNALSTASSTSYSVQSLLGSVGITGLIAGLVVAAVAGFIIWKLIDKPDPNTEAAQW